MAWGAVSGAVSFGVGEIFSTAPKVAGEVAKVTKVAEAIKKVAGDVGLAIVQAGTHAIAQGVLSLMQGGNFVHGAVAGFAGHLGAEAWGGAMKGMGYEQFARSTGEMVVFGALSGGIGAELSGGNFWQGAVTGGIVAGLNSAMHKMWPPKSFNGDVWEDKDGQFIRRRDISNEDRKTYIVNNSPEGIDILVQKMPSTIDKIETSISTISIVSDLNEVLIENRTEGVIGKYGKILKGIGKVTGVWSSIINKRFY